MAVSFNKYNQFVADVANKVHNLGADTLKIALTNRAPLAADAVFATITEITAGNGYTAGGATVTVTASSQTGGVYKLVGSVPSPTWTGTGTFGPFRYAVIYNSTAVNGPLIGYWDYGSAISVNSGDQFTITLDATNGILQLQ